MYKTLLGERISWEVMYECVCVLYWTWQEPPELQTHGKMAKISTRVQALMFTTCEESVHCSTLASDTYSQNTFPIETALCFLDQPYTINTASWTSCMQ